MFAIHCKKKPTSLEKNQHKKNTTRRREQEEKTGEIKGKEKYKYTKEI
jgi:hypothetical protein